MIAGPEGQKHIEGIVWKESPESPSFKSILRDILWTDPEAPPRIAVCFYNTFKPE